MKPKINLKADDCCGCSACAAACPVNAITFQYDKEGFLYPHVEESRCIGCLNCEKVCAFKADQEHWLNQEHEETVYAAKHKNPQIVKNSSSGGVFTALSDWFIKKGNMVVACTYAYERNAVVYSFLADEDARNRARGSKYIQAEAGNSFGKILTWLTQNPEQEMLIIGTGCQIAGLDLLLKSKNLRNRVLLVDLICHGVTSSGLWKKYIQELERQNGGRISYVTFKDKENGWENPLSYVSINDQRVSIKPFSDWFYMGWTIRESCYECPYTKVERRSDITIGDYWGIKSAIPEFYDPMGVSLVIIHNDKGRRVFDEIKNVVDIRISDPEHCLQPRLISPQKRPKDREMFWNDMEKKGLKYCAEKYYEYQRVSWYTVIKQFVKKILFHSKQ